MILPTAYLAPVSWYQQYTVDSQIEIWESFPKRTLRNRCRIMGANGVQIMTVPVQKCDSKQLTKDVRISYQLPWQQQHWQTLVSAYKHSPFFDYYQDYFRPLYECRFDYLIDLNTALHEVVMRLLGKEDRIEYTAAWGAQPIDPAFEPIRPLIPYYQLFDGSKQFAENLSIVDLLFNMGNEGPLFL